MKNTKWITGKYDEATVALLEESLGVSSLTAKLLSVRGVTTPDAASAFTKKDIEDLYDPFLMCVMQHNINKILKAENE